MSGDLDWPLNASRGLSMIAEFLVDWIRRYPFPRGISSAGALNTRGCEKLAISANISLRLEKVQDKLMITVEY